MKKKSYADMDPLEEIRVIREEISGEFKSLRELGAYLRLQRPDAKGGREAKSSERAKSARRETVRKRSRARPISAGLGR